MRTSLLKFLLLCLAFFNVLNAETNDYSIVFVHIGNKIPSYTATAISQAGLFNPNCQIIMLANDYALQDFKQANPNLKYVPMACESLNKTSEHEQFLKNCTLDTTLWDGFWKFTSERFLYLNDLIVQYKMQNVFHMENDNMLYVNLKDLMSYFQHYYKGIAATFDNDTRCIPGFLFIRDSTSIQKLAKCFSENPGSNDMKVLSIFKNGPDHKYIDHLPIIMKAYLKDYNLKSASGLIVINEHLFCLHYEKFDSIFDAAAIGQYLGGVDYRLVNSTNGPGFINESCIFNPSLLRYEWHPDLEGRKIPYAIYKKTKCRINNLHIHSKQLEKFTSK